MDNKGKMTKNKTLKKILCYFALVILIVLLFTPMAFRIAFKEKKEEPKKDVVYILKCNKGDESISSTFLNEQPHKITYTITGNYMTNSEQNENNSETNNETISGSLSSRFINYASFEYDEETNKSSLNFDVEYSKGTPDYEAFFSSIESQESFFNSEGFSCSKQSF